MKKVTAYFLFSLLMFNSAVFGQKTRSPRINTDTRSGFVTFSAAQAFSDGRGVWLEWQTSSETKNLGFYIYRQTADGGRQMVSEGLVAGEYLRPGGENSPGSRYTYFDRNGGADSVYYIESYSLDGQKQLSESVYPKIVDDLREITGKTSVDLTAAKEGARFPLAKSELNLPKDFEAGNRIPPNLDTQRFVASQPGVKIGVKKEGFYRVSKTDLQNAGFDANASPALWQLYLNGVEQSIIVAPNGDYVEFYGQPIDTVESDIQIYYLIVGAANGKRIEPKIFRNLGNVVANSYAQTFTQKQRGIYFTDLLNGEAENYFDSAPINPAGRTLNFNLSGVDFNARRTPITISALGLTLTSHQIRVVLNDNELLPPITGDGREVMSESYAVQTSFLREGVNTLKLYSMNGSSDINFLDYIKIDHARLYLAVNNQLSFYTNNYRASNLSGFTSPNIRVFDLRFPDEPTVAVNLQISENDGVFSVKLPGNRGSLMYAVEDSATAQPYSITPNTPSSYWDDNENTSFLVITHKDFLNQANTWANYRQAQGMNAKVVDIQDIYDEYTYGAQNTDGIRNFLQKAKNDWQTQYVLLLGDAHYDLKNYEGNGYNNFVPTKFVDTVYMETGSDEALADFNDDGLAEIAVGRIAARTPEMVTHAFNKMTTFEAEAVSEWLNRGALFISDQPVGYDFAALSERLRQQLPSNMSAAMITRGVPSHAESRTQMLASMNAGKYIVNYSGHGSVSFWAISSPVFFNQNDSLALTNGNNLSFYTMLTCLNGYFLGDSESLAEALIRAPNGGAAAAWTSTGKTTPDVQEIMATRFFSQVSAGNMPRIGDLIKDAKNTVSGGRDVRLSWVLIGDPAMRLR